MYFGQRFYMPIKLQKIWIQFLNKHDISQIKTNTMIYNQLLFRLSD